MARTLKTVLNESNPNKLPSACQVLPLGDALLGGIRRAVLTVDAAGVGALPEEARAHQPLAATARTGGAPGDKLPVNMVPPGAGNFTVSATGNIQFDVADAVTEAEVLFIGREGTVTEMTVGVVGSTFVLPAGQYGSIILEAEVIVGVTPGLLTPIFRGQVPAAGQVAIGFDGRTFSFNAANIVAGTARIRFLKQPDFTAGENLAREFSGL